MKSIIELCKELPASEGELRERAGEFNATLDEAVQRLDSSGVYVPYHPDGKCGHSSCWRCASSAPKYLHSIADAKAATDATIARGWGISVGTEGSHYECELFLYKSSMLIEAICVTAPTEELARSACALLASEAMKGKEA